MTNFAKIFSINIKHLYYDPEFSEGNQEFELLPSSDTQITLKNHGMIFKNTTEGLVILGEVNTAGTIMAKPVSASTRFRFYLRQKNRNFQTITNVPLTGNEGKTYYFNNRTSQIGTAPYNTGNLLLHGINYVNGSERLEILPEVFSKTLPTSAPQVKIEDVFDAANVPFDSGATSLSGTIQFDLRGKLIRNGRYKLMQNGTQVGSDFYIDADLLRTATFGVVEVFEVNTVNSSYRYVTDALGTLASSPPVYVIGFQNRSTKWKYLVKIRDNSMFNPADLGALIVQNGPAPFTTGTPTSTEVTILSNAAIDFRRITREGIQLHNNNTSLNIIEHLPNPSIEVFKPGSPDDISEIFVYV